MADAWRVTAELRALLDAKLDTMEKFEIALALRGAPARTAAIDDLARQLQVGPSVLGQVVADLARGGVAAVENQNVTLLLDGVEAQLLDDAAVLHKEHRHEMARVFTMIAMDRIRRMAARTFADAFQFRKKKDDDNG